ncbi:MAG: MerR family transcriptional regulator [Coriobacteriia bacterium]|nr:MerR family transcriptional regulator [Coriobacteriia bacterium]
MASQQGWTISQVEALIGLSRRDIQRCCYEGKGGVGILSPEDSKWGRRTYTADDLARLFIVARMKADGMSLPEARRALEQAEDGGKTDAELLRDYAERTAERIEQLETLLLGAKALLAVNGKGDEDLEQIVGQRIAPELIDTALGTADAALPANEHTLKAAVEALDDPGLALAIDLAHDPGAADRLRVRIQDQL